MVAISALAAVAMALFAAVPALADTTGPAISKTVEPLIDANQNVYGGTITLSVTGSASSTTTHTNANVIFVVDTSGSMKEPTGTYRLAESRYGAYDDKGNDLYYKSRWDNDYHLVSDYWGDYRRTVYTKDANSDTYSEYTGTRYSKVGASRLDAAKESIKSAASTILGQNNTTVSLVTFSTNATGYSTVNKTTSISNFNTAVNHLSANGGTNWEAGLKSAEELVSKDSGTSNYVIFVSDGNPTFRDSASYGDRDGYDEDENVYGEGDADTYGYNFMAADTVAKRLIDNGVTLYNINAFGDATNMQNLGGISSDNYFDASDPTKLQNALSKIVQNIVNAHSYRNVAITDNLSDAVVAENTNGNLDSNSVNMTVKNKDNKKVTLTDNHDGTYSYTKDGKPQTFNGPTVSGKKVTWSLGDTYQLEDGWTYTASFDVLFTQDTLNKAADLLNGKLASDPNMTVENGVVKAYTNTASGNDVSYVEETTVDNNKTSAEGTKHFDRPPLTVPVASNLTVSKKVSGNAANTTENYNFVLSNTALAGKTFGSGDDAVTFNSNGAYTFQLSHGQSRSFAGIPVGTEMSVKETGLSGNAKTSTTAKVDGGDARTVKSEGSTATETDPVSVKVIARAYTLEDGKLVAPTDETDANTVEFTNNSTLVPQTGIKIDPLPMVVLLGVAVAGGVAVAAGVRKNHGREE
ncbi:MAG: VWA domain-containing protein [Parafannyhessea sp.]|uniref:vWA domain-containing protein n=1 Tax=Parafannyhessea sp. TaxID=2847324 RepID=UPI003F012C8B